MRRVYGIGYHAMPQPTFHFRQFCSHMWVAMWMYDQTPCMWNTSFGEKEMSKTESPNVRHCVWLAVWILVVHASFVLQHHCSNSGKRAAIILSPRGYIKHKDLIDAIVQHSQCDSCSCSVGWVSHFASSQARHMARIFEFEYPHF